jgi:hypothetical protein
VLRFSDTILLRLAETMLPHWRQKQAVDVTTTKVNPIYGTKTERRAALKKARQEMRMPRLSSFQRVSVRPNVLSVP